MLNSLRYLHKIVILLLGGSLLVSCFENEEIDISTYNDLIISNISFGTLPRTMHTTTKDGRDSTYSSTISAGTTYPFTIDQLNNVAYNLDSLPLGVRLDKIIFSTMTVNSGTLTIQKLKAEEDTVYATADTLDFSKGPRVFHLYGIDGTSRRTYTVDVRVHQQKEDSVTWRQHDKSDWAGVEQYVAAKGEEYSAASLTFRLGEGTMMCSADGETFVEDSVRTSEKKELPIANLTWISGPTRADKTMTEVLMYGTVADGDNLVGKVWRRNISNNTILAMGWEYLPGDIENPSSVKGVHHASLFAYDKGFLLTGVQNDGTIYVKYSADHGRTWKNHTSLVLPKSLKDRKVETLEAAVDADSNLWLLIDGEELWYGRAHKVAWREDQRVFE